MEISYSTFEMCVINNYCFQCGSLNTLTQIPFNSDFLMKSCKLCDCVFSLYLKHDITQSPTISISDNFQIPNEEILAKIKSKFH